MDLIKNQEEKVSEPFSPKDSFVVTVEMTNLGQLKYKKC